MALPTDPAVVWRPLPFAASAARDLPACPVYSIFRPECRESRQSGTNDIEEQRHRRAREALNGLGEPARSIMIAYYVAETPVREIAVDLALRRIGQVAPAAGSTVLRNRLVEGNELRRFRESPFDEDAARLAGKKTRPSRPLGRHRPVSRLPRSSRKPPPTPSTLSSAHHADADAPARARVLLTLAASDPRLPWTDWRLISWSVASERLSPVWRPSVSTLLHPCSGCISLLASSRRTASSCSERRTRCDPSWMFVRTFLRGGVW